MLVHFDPELPLIVACDASPFGLGGTLSHIYPDKTERPIMFVSRTLNKAEQNYTQVDHEAVALFWTVKKLDYFLRGRHFTLVTDNKPIVSIFNNKKATPIMAADHIQRWAVFLKALSYDIVHMSKVRYIC